MNMILFPPQEQVLEQGILDKQEHCFLNMATGSGKTFLAELEIEKILRSSFKAIYVTPLRALAEQQKENWVNRFPGYRIGVFTGDTIRKSNTRNSYSSSQLLIMTPERLDAILRNWKNHWSWFTDVSLVVIDEAHLIGQPYRGPRLEGSITRMIRLNPFLRILGLSATMPNHEELAAWLRGVSFGSSWRQVPLGKSIVRFKHANEKPELLLRETERCVKNGGQSLIFCNSRSRVHALADFLKDHGVRAECHHAGLRLEKRKEIEYGFRAGEVRVLVSTSTLEMGLNLPARQVIIYDSSYFSESGYEPIPVWSFIQRAGRAGRPGLDAKGEVVLFLSKWAAKGNEYLEERCEHVDSQLTDSRAMQEQILIEICAGFSRSLNELMNGFLPLTLYKFQHDEANLTGTVNRMILADLLTETEDEDGSTRLKVGLLGRLAVRLMLSPETVKMIQDCYNAFERVYLFDLLLIAALSNDCDPVLRVNYEEIDELCETVLRQPSVLMDMTTEELRKRVADVSVRRILSAIKMAAVCLHLIRDEDPEEIVEKYDVYTADILILKENVIRLLTGMSAIFSALDKRDMGEEGSAERKNRPGSRQRLCAMLADMLQYQIPSEYIALTRLQGIGGKTARSLAENGYSTLQKIAEADPAELARIKGIGKKTAERIVVQAAEVSTEEPEVYREELLEDIATVRGIKTAVDPYRLRRSMELSVKGAEGGKYLVTGGQEDHVVLWREGIYFCDCKDYEKRKDDCKHILCVRRAKGDAEILRMDKKIRENKSHPIREALPSLWYAITKKEER